MLANLSLFDNYLCLNGMLFIGLKVLIKFSIMRLLRLMTFSKILICDISKSRSLKSNKYRLGKIILLQSFKILDNLDKFLNS